MAIKSRTRLDEALVQRGFASSLGEAEVMILAGRVIVDEQKVEKRAVLIATTAAIRVKPLPPYVSRGGEKLAAALQALGLCEVIKGAVVLDVGASTGGFTDCCLQHGAAKVYAVDIGTNQLAWKMRSHSQVISMEKTDIRLLPEGHFSDVSMVVADISFNSIRALLPAIIRVVPPKNVQYLVLVKPQFELSREKIPDGGVVADESLRHEALILVENAFKDLGFGAGKSVDSALPGRSGNQEIFYYICSASCPSAEKSE